MTLRRLSLLFAVAASITAASQAVAQNQPAVPASADQTAVFRFDPFHSQMVPVAPAEVKAGYLYNHFSDALGRRAWALAQPGGGFSHAIGEGSVQPAWRLDLRTTPQQAEQALEARSPQLSRMLKTAGGIAYIRLGVGDQWKLVDNLTTEKFFDLETGLRWEWHGQHVVSVVHTFGDRWTIVDGHYVPIGGEPSETTLGCCL